MSLASILGLVTPIDLLEAIAGEFPEEGELPDIQPQATPGHWVVDGQVDLHALETATEIYTLAQNDETTAPWRAFCWTIWSSCPPWARWWRPKACALKCWKWTSAALPWWMCGELHKLIALNSRHIFDV